MDLVIERADSGLVFAAFNGDSLREQLRSGTLAAPYVDWNGLLPLTATAPESLNATLRDFAARPGAREPLAARRPSDHTSEPIALRTVI